MSSRCLAKSVFGGLSWNSLYYLRLCFCGSVSYYSQEIDVPNWFSGPWPMETCLHTCSPLVGPESFSQVRIFLDEDDDSSKANPGQGRKRGISRRGLTGLNPLCWRGGQKSVTAVG